MKLKYFKNLNPQLRRLVIQRAEYKLVPRDTVLYKQSEEGHHFYILIRGSVTLLSNRADFGNFDLYLRSYYDGDVFGE
jgi:CRP-like cAMP-binding protein